MSQTDADEEGWRGALSEPGFAPQARIFKWLPSNPRCPLCQAPYGLPFGPIVHLLGFGRSKRYPQLCNPCFRQMERYRGGAEVEVTVLFADVRGSTGMAERSSASEFNLLLSRFYALVTQAVRDEGGIIDKFLGDGVMALFIPSFTEKRHAQHGLNAARRILRDAELPIGVGLNTGKAFTGFLGPSDEVAGFSAVGDAVNVAHRLGEAAGPGELLVGGDELSFAEPPAADPGGTWDKRELQVKGRDQAVRAWSLQLQREAVA
ncbi:MAG: adenylate/guanylate cyclase domain-containing protein [Chloroflexi bacterium]|nr:adenylate/guanylate cyclase domain-containing protein [Chloroflexota bacterium]